MVVSLDTLFQNSVTLVTTRVHAFVLHLMWHLECLMTSCDGSNIAHMKFNLKISSCRLQVIIVLNTGTFRNSMKGQDFVFLKVFEISPIFLYLSLSHVNLSSFLGK